MCLFSYSDMKMISSRWQVDKEAIGLSRVQQLISHLWVSCLYQISVNFIFIHVYTASIKSISRSFVQVIYHSMGELLLFYIQYVVLLLMLLCSL